MNFLFRSPIFSKVFPLRQFKNEWKLNSIEEETEIDKITETAKEYCLVMSQVAKQF